MGCAELQVCLFADCREWRFQAAKRSYMSSAILQDGRLADPQRLRFQAAKHSDMGSAVQQGGRFSDTQELRFQASKCSYMVSAVLQGGRFVDIMNCVFRLRKVQILAVPPWRDFSLMMLRNRVFWLRNFKYGFWCPARRRFATSQESRFQAPNHSYIGSAVLQGGQFDGAQEWRFHGAKRKIGAVASNKGIVKLMQWNRVFRLRNVQICVQCRHGRNSIY